MIVCKSSRSWVDGRGEFEIKTVGNGHDFFCMNGVVLDVWIPVTISDVEIACHQYSGSDVPHVVLQNSEGCLITIQIHVDDEIIVLSVVKVNNVDVSMIYKVLSQEEPHF